MNTNDNTARACDLIAQGIQMILSDGSKSNGHDTTGALSGYLADDVVNAVQDLVNTSRTLIRASKDGVDLTAKQRNQARRSIKALKATLPPGQIVPSRGDWLGDTDVD
jgi:hypothetical protein